MKSKMMTFLEPDRLLKITCRAAAGYRRLVQPMRQADARKAFCIQKPASIRVERQIPRKLIKAARIFAHRTIAGVIAPPLGMRNRSASPSRLSTHRQE